MHIFNEPIFNLYDDECDDAPDDKDDDDYKKSCNMCIFMVKM